ncbi:MAG TPA: Spy/CpxP family protein refolding chaperone [Steroidobacteraceae bacterium]|nr:Spy/CpxP family protein refolding chaperone [Steroidobacteraceae bacterium]
MKPQMKWFAVARQRLVEAGALLAFGAALLSSGPAWPDAAQTSPGAAAGAHAAGSAMQKKPPGIDGLIDHLHESFKITPAQEPLWRKVVSVMRENSEELGKLAKERAEGSANRTAVDDLKSYAEISDAHAAGTRKLIPAFQALYDSMSAEQKKAADAEFREHYSGHRPHMRMQMRDGKPQT